MGRVWKVKILKATVYITTGTQLNTKQMILKQGLIETSHLKSELASQTLRKDWV